MKNCDSPNNRYARNAIVIIRIGAMIVTAYPLRISFIHKVASFDFLSILYPPASCIKIIARMVDTVAHIPIKYIPIFIMSVGMIAEPVVTGTARGVAANTGFTSIKLDIDAVRVAFTIVRSTFFFFFGKLFTSFSIVLIKKDWFLTCSLRLISLCGLI